MAWWHGMWTGMGNLWLCPNNRLKYHVVLWKISMQRILYVLTGPKEIFLKSKEIHAFFCKHQQL